MAQPPRVIAGFTVPKRRGPLFEAALRYEAELALGRIWSCLKAELSLAEAAEIFARFKIAKKRGRPALSESKKRYLLALADKVGPRFAAKVVSDKPGATEKAIQRLRRERKRKENFGSNPLENNK